MNTNYKIIEKKNMPYIKSEATVFSHKSGSKIMYIKNEDKNKVFSVSFKTPPVDDTGLFHILEHSVLAGSKKFPVKEPFNELVKGSLFTYLNAMTFSDKTMYPIGSCNNKDFLNLMEVYLDAVFFPKVHERKESFLQEGWHINAEKKDSPLSYNGIVYNEMKGAYSDPLRVLDNITNRHLFSENAYRFDSGGNPEFITKLSYKDFLKAHKKYYHPANSYIYFYGDLDIDKCLELLHHDYLSKFVVSDFSEPLELKKQSLMLSPITCEGSYCVPVDSNINGKKFLSASYIVGDYSNAEEYYAYKLLANILLATPASPVKKALIEEGMGEEILGGFDSDMLETVFNITVKNSEKDIEEFKTVLNNIFTEIVKVGIGKELVESCLNKMEFLYKEEDYGYRPKGLVYNIISMSSWLYGGNPFEKLDKLEIIKNIRTKVKEGNYFENLIKTQLLNNNRCVYSIIKPKQGLSEQKDEFLAKKLDEFKNNISEEELEKFIKQSKALMEYQNKKDEEKDLAKIPFVKISDVDEKYEKIPFVYNKDNDFDIFHTSLDTNDIIYTNIIFNTDKVGKNKLYIIGLLSYFLGKLSTQTRNYSELSNKINYFLGGFNVTFSCLNEDIKSKKYSTNLCIKTKAIYNNTSYIFDITEEIVNQTIFSDEKRLKVLLNEIKSHFQSIILTSGNLLALGRAEAYMYEFGKYKDEVTGISFYNKVKEITDNFEDNFENLKKDLEDVSSVIFNKENYSINFTCDKQEYYCCESYSKNFYKKLKDSKNNKIKDISMLGLKNEAFATSSMVQYNVMIGDYRKKTEYNGYLYLLSNIISNVYFMDEIRLKGGAYGFGANVATDGFYQFYSYRDPNLMQTYNIYNEVSKFIENANISESEMKKHILGAINRLDRYLLPQAKGEIAFNRYLKGITNEKIEKERIELLSAKWCDLKRFINVFDKEIEKTAICMIGNSTKISKENSIFKVTHNLGI